MIVDEASLGDEADQDEEVQIDEEAAIPLIVVGGICQEMSELAI